ncbi:MAG: ComEC family competence protein [Rhodobacteraceae bacterium]|nr:ComEC family competence protein [Paracoccaceae bacterium]
MPVFFGAGVGGYFALRTEPTMLHLSVLGAVAFGLTLASFRWVRGGPVLLALALVAMGCVVAAYRTHSVAAPVLDFRYYGPIEGRIVGMDRSSSDKLRLTLSDVVLRRMAPADTPGRVRVSLHGDQSALTPQPGMTVILTGHLSPPQGPVEPGGFDFQRQAWFRGLGAVGYTRTPVLMLEPAAPGWTVFRLRMALADGIRAAMPETTGPFAAAIMVGDRSAIGQGQLDDLRASNLAHLLAISGLHMGLMTGFVFAALRVGMALFPAFALRWPTKKIAAVGALLAGLIYLILSGGAVATFRAFIMVAVMFAAVLFDRRAITLRSVAIAALIVMATRPEDMLGPGFQMSFAATTALVAVFGALREVPYETREKVPRWLRPALVVLLSSFVAGLATAPIAAVHFNQVPHYGLIANLLSVPVMGAVIMPAAVLAACLSPLGLHWIGLAIMHPAIAWILEVAERVAALPGALSFLPTPPIVVLPLLALGALTVILWQGRARFLGAIPVLLSGLIWFQGDRPDMLIAATGGLVGVMTESEGRVLSKARGEGFVARSWLENDGDPADQDVAHARAEVEDGRGRANLSFGTMEVVHLWGKSGLAVLDEACAEADLVILGSVLEGGAGPADCTILDADVLRERGALALTLNADGYTMRAAYDVAGARPWNAVR